MRSRKKNHYSRDTAFVFTIVVRSFAQVTAVLFTESDREATWGGKAAKIGLLLRLGLGLLGLHVARAYALELGSHGQLLGSPLPSQVLK